MSLLEPSPCAVCGAMIVKPHPRSECAWVLRERCDGLEAERWRLSALVESTRLELAEAQAALVVAQAMAGQR